MRVLGIVMAKKGSQRIPHKNIIHICRRPLMAYAIESLVESRVCDKVIVATNNEDYGKIGVKHGADDYVIRSSETDKFRSLSVSAEDALMRWENETGDGYDVMISMGANCMFLRPSWIRAAVKVIEGFAYNRMPIEAVSITPLSQWYVVASRIKQGGITTNPHFFELKHCGLFMEIDWDHELELAHKIQIQIEAGTIHYPLKETVHEDILERMNENPNYMGGLTPL